MSQKAVLQFTARATLALGVIVAVGGLAPQVVFAAVTLPGATTGAVSSINPTTAVVRGSVDPNGGTTSWYFDYGATTSYGAKSATSTTASAKSVAVTLTGLAPATGYHYRLVATNSAGVTDGVDGIFSTDSTPNVVTQPTSGLGATSATLNGIVNAEGLTTSAYFEYGTTAKLGSKSSTKGVPAGAGNIAIAIPVSGLRPTMSYFYRVVAKNSAGTSLGTLLTFTTGQPITINANAFEVVTGGSVTLTGAIDSGKSGIAITVFARRFDQGAAVGVATVTTGPGGAWAYVTAPTARTTYQVSGSGGTSSMIEIAVRPKVTLVTLSGGRFRTGVVGYIPFAHRILQLQRLSNGTWVTVKREAMNGSGTAIFPSSLLPHGRSTVRTAIGPDVIGVDQAAPGLLAGYSVPRIFRRS